MDFLDVVLALKYPPVNDFTNAEAENSSDGKGRVFTTHFVCFFNKSTFWGQAQGRQDSAKEAVFLPAVAVQSNLCLC